MCHWRLESTSRGGHSDFPLLGCVVNGPGEALKQPQHQGREFEETKKSEIDVLPLRCRAMHRQSSRISLGISGMFDQAGFAGSGLTAHHRCLTVLTVSTCIDGISFTRVDEEWLRRHGTRFFDCLHIPSTMFSPSTFRKLPYITSSLVSNPPAAKATNAAGDLSLIHI